MLIDKIAEYRKRKHSNDKKKKTIEVMLIKYSKSSLKYLKIFKILLISLLKKLENYFFFSEFNSDTTPLPVMQLYSHLN